MNENRKPRTGNRGLALAEVLAATFVLMVALLGLLGAIVSCIFLNETSRNTTVAVNHITEIIEEMRTKTLTSDIVNEDWDGWLDADKTLAGEAVVVEYPQGAGANPLEVKVIINWLDRQRARSVYLQTLATDK